MANRRFRRKTATRDVKKLIIIATEGSKTELQYFDSLRSKFGLRNVKPLKRKRTRSSPLDVLKQLNREKGKLRGTQRSNEYWAVIDKDNWSKQILEQFITSAQRKGYKVADSNPCFELWLLLHYESVGRLKGLEGSAATGGCASVERELKKFDKNYDKSRYESAKYIEKIDNAIKNAAKTDTQPQDRWLNQIGTRVYRLAQSIIPPSAKRLDN